MNFYTPAEYKFLKKASHFLNDALETGKTIGIVPIDASVYLRVADNLSDPDNDGETMLCLKGQGKNTKQIYIVCIRRSCIGDWNLIRHEAGHVHAGHPSRGTPSGTHLSRGDFLNYIERELEAEIFSRYATKTMPFLGEDMFHLMGRVSDNFGMPDDDAFKAVKQIAQKRNIPYKYIKDTKRLLDWSNNP